jgi:hypothetical protein
LASKGKNPDSGTGFFFLQNSDIFFAKSTFFMLASVKKSCFFKPKLLLHAGIILFTLELLFLRLHPPSSVKKGIPA